MRDAKIHYIVGSGYRCPTPNFPEGIGFSHKIVSGVVVTVALLAIALSIMALLNLKANIEIFHALGGMKEGAYVLLGGGVAAIAGVLLYLYYVKNKTEEALQHYLESTFGLEELNSKFDLLEAQRIEQNIDSEGKGRYYMWSPNQSQSTVEGEVYFFQIDPDKRRQLVAFTVYENEGEATQEMPEASKYHTMLMEKDYLYRDKLYPKRS